VKPVISADNVQNQELHSTSPTCMVDVFN